MLIKKLISRLREPSLACLQHVLDELKQIDQMIVIREFEVYPILGRNVKGVVDDMLLRFTKPAQHMIENIIKVELTYINIEHPDFIGGARVIGETNFEESRMSDEPHFIIDKDAQSFQSFEHTPNRNSVNMHKPEDQRDLAIIKRLIESYYKIVKKNIEDSVPKAIMGFLVNKSKTKIQTELVSNIYKEERIFDLLAEPGDIAEKRVRCRELLRSLERASQIINEVRHFT